jgi:hypothetical protein
MLTNTATADDHPPGTAPIKQLPTALKQAALPVQGRGWPMITSASLQTFESEGGV